MQLNAYDWLSCVTNRLLSPMARAVYIDLRCAIEVSPTKGRFLATVGRVARLSGLSELDANNCLDELKDMLTFEDDCVVDPEMMKAERNAAWVLAGLTEEPPMVDARNLFTAWQTYVDGKSMSAAVCMVAEAELGKILGDGIVTYDNLVEAVYNYGEALSLGVHSRTRLVPLPRWLERIRCGHTGFLPGYYDKGRYDAREGATKSAGDMLVESDNEPV